MNLKPWREIAVPHEDVLKGTFQQAEFAADLSRVHEGTATAEYQNPALFFQRTFITEGMRLLLDSVVKRLSGSGGDPVIQLQTAFGGGKTHTMLAVYHIAKGEVTADELLGIPQILSAAGVSALPRARIAVLDGIRLSPNQPMSRNGIAVNTLWGELAVQLGGAEGYELVRNADLSGTSPGKAVLETLLSRFAPCVILIDELVAYIRQFEEGKSLSGGTFDSNLTFIQALTEALKAVPTAILLASLPESEKEAGSQRGLKALSSLEHNFARVQALWKPVSSEEAFEIVRRRLFSSMNDKRAVETVCRAFSDFYVANSADFPNETQESRYFDRLMHAYPIHPEVFDRLYEDWSSLDTFQRTRGVLRLMSIVIHRLWKDGNNDLLIMPGSLPLYDVDTRNEAIRYLPQGWDPILEREIDGEHAKTTDIENRDTRFGSVQACRRSCRSIFLGSAPTTTTQMVRGLDLEHVLLGSVQPGQQVGTFKDALRRLGDNCLQYLYSSDNHFWFDTRPSLSREMDERKRRFQDKEDIYPVIRDGVQRSFASNIFSGIHVFSTSGDVPDDWHLRLVVLPPDAAFSRNGHNSSYDHAKNILQTRGDQPRQKQNRLIFLAADYDCVSRLKDQVRSMLSWQSIVDDIKDMKLNLDQFQSRQATKSLEGANESLRRMIRETYKWLLAPTQDAQAGKGISEIQWEYFPINSGALNLGQEVEHILKDNEIIITEWAPIHLSNLLKTWFWKEDTKEVNALDLWQKTCCYLYLPRLKDDSVFKLAINSGTESVDFFGLAQGKENDKYIGFSFGKPAVLFLDTALLLIDPRIAAAYASLQKNDQIESGNLNYSGSNACEITYPSTENAIRQNGVKDATVQAPKRQFYGIAELDPVLAKKQFSDVVDEILLQFTSRPDVDVKITIEIQAKCETGFDNNQQRVVKENCNQLKFKSSEFEDGD